MVTDNKYLETGSSPYHLNLNTTAKEFSLNDSSNPQYGFLDTISKFTIIENEFEIEPLIIIQEVIPNKQAE